MPRARNIKHSFFTNDELAEQQPLGRLLFAGLWTISDYKGDLELKPRKIKALILPYDNCDIIKLLINLDKSRFITIYSLQDELYVHINNFVKHQNPHPNEKRKGSDIPKYSIEHAQPIDSKGVAINHDKIKTSSDKIRTNNADSLSLIPDSRSLNPDPLSLNPDSLNPDKPIVGQKPDDFEQVWIDYGKKGNKKTSLQKYRRLNKEQLILFKHHFPRYVAATPDKQYRKGLQSYIEKECWNDELPQNSYIKTIDESMNEATAQAERVAKHLGFQL